MNCLEATPEAPKITCDYLGSRISVPVISWIKATLVHGGSLHETAPERHRNLSQQPIFIGESVPRLDAELKIGLISGRTSGR
jgi:hypothetical protein